MRKAFYLLFIVYFFLLTAGNVIIAAEEPAAAEPPVMKAAEVIQLGATNAPARNVTLGSTDPKSGFKFEVDLTSSGAAISKAVFSEFNNRDSKDPKPLVILSPVKLSDDREVLSMANKEFVFDKQQLQLPLDRLHWQSFDVQSLQDGSQTARFEATIKDEDSGSPVIKLVKTYKVTPDSFLLDCELTIENLSPTEQKVRFNFMGPVGISQEDTGRDDKKVVAGFRDSKGGITSVRLDANKLHKAESPEDRRLTKAGADFLWTAVINKYFAAILVPVPDKDKGFCDWVTDKAGRFYNPDDQPDTGDETVGVELKIAPSQLAAAGSPDSNSTKTYNFQLYLGPKDKSLFDKNQLYSQLGFFHTIDFMACFCCPAAIIQPLAFGILAIMKWMYVFIPNYGVVIIILVFLMRLAMHPITKKSQVSMSKMQKVLSDPEVQEIKKKYSKTPMEMQRRIAAFQKERGVSQASSVMNMLPMFVQMPIWIALYSAIYASIDLRGAAFLPFWITDLSVPDALIRFSTVTVPL
ncbi:MAG: YidC/Oxa1 family insertase periplasmic-domain containing protein, partial [Phycisphaerae bacterium]